MVKAEWDSYCPTTSGLPAISWKLLAMMKSALFIASKSAVNWALKWYLSSFSRLHRLGLRVWDIYTVVLTAMLTSSAWFRY